MATRSVVSQSADLKTNQKRAGKKRARPGSVTGMPNAVRFRAALVFLRDVGGMKAAQKALAQICEFKRCMDGRPA